ncbi:hypothetical protein HYV98_01300, partial [Candidatus Azambacteria bacterium]|nr:hypothetical protein [Candidatus Azambacteria bacterium]
VEMLPELLSGTVTVIHQAGSSQMGEAQREAAMYLSRVKPEAAKRYLLYPFLDEGQYFYALAAADLVISRAGAGGIFEIAAMGKPSILVPITQAAGDHQRHNAYDYAETGAAEVLEEGNLTPNLFYSTIKRLLDDPQRRSLMSAAAKTFAKPEAARVIAGELLKLTV